MKISQKNQMQETAISECCNKIKNDKQKGKIKKLAKDITRQSSNTSQDTSKETVTRLIKVSPQQKQGCYVQEYQAQIIQHLLKKQVEQKHFSIDHQYLKKCNYLNLKTRNFVVKYILKIGKSYKLKRSTLFLATYYMDYYFSHTDYLDTEGIILYTQTALFIAMKYQQIYPPQLYEWTNKNKAKEISIAQSNILKVLDFNLNLFSLQNFIEYYSSKEKLSLMQRQTIKFLSDITLFDETMYRFKPSLLARSIIDSVVYPGKMSQKMELNIKWMVQRNQKVSIWLKDFQYQRLK